MSVVPSLPESHKMGLTEQKVLTDKISRDFSVAELKLNYQNVYEELWSTESLTTECP